MKMQTENFLEMLSKREVPIWYIWDGDLPILINGIQKKIFFYLEQYQKDVPWQIKNQINLLLWLLDRLVNNNSAEIFLNFLGKESKISRLSNDLKSEFSQYAFPQAVYAWGRRLSSTDREKLFAIALHGDYRLYQSVVAAWAETCPSEQADSLFSWPDVSYKNNYLPKHDFYLGMEILLKEFVRRVKHRHLRIPTLIAITESLFEKAKRTDIGKLKYLYATLFHKLITQLLKDIAPDCDIFDSPKLNSRESEPWI